MEGLLNSSKTNGQIHDAVKSLYSNAAAVPQPGLCCPQDYAAEWRQHIPKEALEFNYGCGSPVLTAGIKEGDVVVDLGSGVGIDCFVAAKLVGRSGKVYGIDMTDAMLEKANRYKADVALNLGYDVVEFRKGQIEDIPLEDGIVNIVVSNCVLNLSPNKPKVFREIARILAHGGKAVISDVVSDIDVPEEGRNDHVLWSECYTGALSVNAFVKALEEAGLSAVAMVQEKPWTDIDGVRYASITVETYRFAKGKTCNYDGNTAIYLGPYAMVVDEEGHQFPRFSPIDICTDTASRLAAGPYANSFTITAPMPKIDKPTEVKQAATACCDSGCGC